MNPRKIHTFIYIYFSAVYSPFPTFFASRYSRIRDREFASRVLSLVHMSGGGRLCLSRAIIICARPFDSVPNANFIRLSLVRAHLPRLYKRFFDRKTVCALRPWLVYVLRNTCFPRSKEFACFLFPFAAQTKAERTAHFVNFSLLSKYAFLSLFTRYNFA